LDDIVYNIIHDIVLNTHREEKMAKSTTAAILVEQKAAETAPPSDDSNPAAPEVQHRVALDSAIYENGKVYLVGNPLHTTKETICPKCHLPRLLYPSDGVGARKPESGVEYCKKRPYIEKPYHDIYGQTFQMEGPGRGKKKKDMVNPLLQSAKENTPNGSQDSPNPSPPPGEAPKPISFPHAKCHNCNTFLPIKRMNNHMIKCIGGGGRDSSRAALLKIQNGNGTGSQNGNTPPGSRTGTPIPPGQPNPKGKNSPNKRDAGDDFDSDSSPQKKKKLLKKNLATKLKAPKMAKSGSQMSSSNLSFEQKAPATDDEDDDGGDDDNDADFGVVLAEPKKKVIKPMIKKSKDSVGIERKKKWLHGKGGQKPSLLPPADPPDSPSGLKLKIKSSSNSNGDSRTKVLPPKSLVNGTSKAHGTPSINGKSAPGVVRADSESSQTLSSPN
jgi:hypothetical protein